MPIAHTNPVFYILGQDVGRVFDLRETNDPWALYILVIPMALVTL